MEEGDGDSPRIANPEDDTTDTWNRHCQISEKEGEQLRIVANREQLRTAASKGRAIEGLQLIVSNCGL